MNMNKGKEIEFAINSGNAYRLAEAIGATVYTVNYQPGVSLPAGVVIYDPLKESWVLDEDQLWRAPRWARLNEREPVPDEFVRDQVEAALS